MDNILSRSSPLFSSRSFFTIFFSFLKIKFQANPNQRHPSLMAPVQRNIGTHGNRNSLPPKMIHNTITTITMTITIFMLIVGTEGQQFSSRDQSGLHLGSVGQFALQRHHSSRRKDRFRENRKFLGWIHHSCRYRMEHSFVHLSSECDFGTALGIPFHCCFVSPVITSVQPFFNFTSACQCVPSCL